MLIKKYELRTELLVASPTVDDWYREHEQEFSFSECETVDDKGLQPVARNGNGEEFVNVSHVTVDEHQHNFGRRGSEQNSYEGSASPRSQHDDEAVRIVNLV